MILSKVGGKRIRYSMYKIIERDMCIDEQITQNSQNTSIYPWKSNNESSTGVNAIISLREKNIICRYKDFDDNYMNKQISKFSIDGEVYGLT